MQWQHTSVELDTAKLAELSLSPGRGAFSSCFVSWLPLISTIQCGGLFVWTFDVCFLVLYTLWSPPKWISLCSAWICEHQHPIQSLTFFSVLASDPKHLHSCSTPPDSAVPLNSLFTAAVVLGTWPQESWTGVQPWACKSIHGREHWTACIFQWATQILTGPALSPHLPWWSQASFLDCGHSPSLPFLYSWMDYLYSAWNVNLLPWQKSSLIISGLIWKPCAVHKWMSDMRNTYKCSYDVCNVHKERMYFVLFFFLNKNAYASKSVHFRSV